MEQKEMTYETAMGRLEEMAREMEADNVPIDHLAAMLKECKEMIAFCKEKLTRADEEVKKLLEELEE